jgi:hypothetical protein
VKPPKCIYYFCKLPISYFSEAKQSHSFRSTEYYGRGTVLIIHSVKMVLRAYSELSVLTLKHTVCCIKMNLNTGREMYEHVCYKISFFL